MRMNKEELARFMGRVKKTKTCWLWTGGMSCPERPYGIFWMRGKTVRSHRLLFQHIHNLDLVPAQFVCHKCDNSKCVKPSHMFLGDNRANMIDCTEKGRLPAAKLNQEKADQIRKLYKLGYRNIDLVNKFGVSHTQIREIIEGLYWNRSKKK